MKEKIKSWVQKPNAIVTIPPHAPYINEVLAHPFTSGIRLNTVMPTKGSLEDVLGKLKIEANKLGKKVWIDLKCRQLRVADFGVPPFTEITLTHELEVKTPVTAYFSDGEERAKVLAVDGKRLIMQNGPKRVVGPGESVNIPDASLNVKGYLTETDIAYIQAASKVGLHDFMLSFVEDPADKGALLALDPLANIVEKIESKKGMDYVKNNWEGSSRLMTARGDLYVELGLPHHVLRASEDIIKSDPNAIAASRILSSLSRGLEPSCADLNDIDNLFRMGYRTLMLGDEVCTERDSVLSALNVLAAVGGYYTS